jgi:signal transduction histidine kinase
MSAGRVLIVEDDEGIGVLEQMCLQRAGYDVKVARDTRQALAHLTAGGIHLIVLDYTLDGEQTGLEFYRSLEAMGLRTPAILVTGLSDESRLIEALRLGIRDFVPKQEEFTEHLLTSVERVMRQALIERRLVEVEEERRVAEAHSRIKDEFIAVLSHELRTPMTAILGWAKILKNGGVEPAILGKALQVIERNAEAQIRLIDDLLDVSRIITRKVELVLEPCDIASVLNSSIDAIRPAAETKGVAIDVSLPDTPISMNCDNIRIQQIFGNLLSNAIKFTPSGGKVVVSAGCSDDDIEVLITDTGIGIDTDFLPYIFDRFRQADASITRKYQGLGIGLAIVRHLVDLHQGSVVAESGGKDKGSKFRLKFPRKDAAA